MTESDKTNEAALKAAEAEREAMPAGSRKLLDEIMAENPKLTLPRALAELKFFGG